MLWMRAPMGPSIPTIDTISASLQESTGRRGDGGEPQTARPIGRCLRARRSGWRDQWFCRGLMPARFGPRTARCYGRRQTGPCCRREVKQAEYVEDFEAAVISFLAFHERHVILARRMAGAVTAHATPVGSGTVARTQRIPIERRAEAAVIAWMRHQTTAYDSMKIARVKGKRREVRRMLAERSRDLLHRYRRGEPATPGCPLADALARSHAVSGARAPAAAGMPG
jgi:hypothetical protein